MVNQLTSLMFFGIILTLTVFDMRRVNSLLTPFTVTAWPFVGIFLLTNIYLVNIGFKPVTIRVQLFILMNLFILWFIGYISYFIIENHEFQFSKSVKSYEELFGNIARYHLFIIVIAWVSIIIVMYKVKSLFGLYGGFQFVGNPQFEEKMIVGPVAHITHLEKVCFLLLAFSIKKSKYKFLVIFTLVGLFVGIAAVQVKYHLIWVLLMVFLFYTVQKPVRQQIKMIAFSVMGMIIVMNLFWILLTLAWGTFSFESEGIREFLLKQTFNYVASSPIVLDEWLSHPNVKPEWTMIIVLKNFINVIVGNVFRYNNVELVNLSFSQVARGVLSNTGTAYGVYYIIGGIIFTIFMTVLLAIIAYIVFYVNRHKKTFFWTYFNILLLMLFLLTFFVQYFTLVSLYEMTAIFMIFIGIFRFFDYINSFSSSGIIKNDGF